MDNNVYMIIAIHLLFLETITDDDGSFRSIECVAIFFFFFNEFYAHDDLIWGFIYVIIVTENKSTRMS